MWNFRRILTGWCVIALAVGANVARADDQNVVSLTCRGMEVQKALAILRSVSDLRVVVDPKVPRKRITLSFKDLPPEDALRTVVSAAGLSYRKIGNAFLVEPKQTASISADRARAALHGESVSTNAAGSAPGLAGGIVQPNGPTLALGAAADAQKLAAVAVSPELLAGLEHPVDVDVKNGPLAEVMGQLSRSSGLKVTAAAELAAGRVATLGLHGIPLKDALEQVAGLTGLQISPRPDGVALVTPGFSLDAAQARTRSAPAGARRVEQGQLWTAEWANVLTSGISAFNEANSVRSLRRQPANPDGRPIEFKPRSGGPRQVTPAAAAHSPKANGEKKTVTHATGKSSDKKKQKSPSRSEE